MIVPEVLYIRRPTGELLAVVDKGYIRFYDLTLTNYITFNISPGSPIEFTFPTALPPNGLSGLWTTDSDGNITVTEPTTHLDDLTVGTSLNDVIDRINALQAVLRTKAILLPLDEVIVPDPVEMILDTTGENIVIPEPATFILSTYYPPDPVASFGLSSVDPTVVIA